MIQHRPPIAVLDASVLYPNMLRNILMYLGVRDLVHIRWTERIHDEWMRSFMRDRPDLKPASIKRTRHYMDENLNDALVSDYEHHIEEIILPDPDDRHVVAAAIEAQATIIVTVNLRDFPNKVLAQYGIKAQHPDAFILDLLKIQPADVVAALHEMRMALKNPPVTAPFLLEAMRKNGLNMTVDGLQSYLSLL